MIDLRSLRIAFARLVFPAAIGAALVLAAFARAEEPKPWTVDMTTVLTDENGAIVKDEWLRPRDEKDCSKCPDLTLGAAVAHALFYVSPDEHEVTGEQKWAWSALAVRIKSDSAAKLTHAEAALIYQRLGRLYSGIVLLRAMPLIDPNLDVPKIK
jgi:hypothetical protein